MDEKLNCMKWQSEHCRELFGSKLESIVVRLDANDKAQEKLSIEMERRLDILNHLRSQFADETIALERRVAKLETRSVVWISLIGLAFAILQLYLRFGFK